MFGRCLPALPAEGEEVGLGPMAADLYRALKREVGRVKIGAPGELFGAVPAGHDFRVSTWGELYHFNCPYCGDDRMRGWASYMFGQRRPGRMRPWLNPIGCWNEDCFADRSRRDLFFARLLGIGLPRLGGPVDAFPAADTTGARPWRARVAKLPDGTLPLGELQASHGALAFVRDRGFDPAAVGADYGLGYCMGAEEEWSIATHRLIVPAWVGGRLVGWQARRLDGGKKLKYWTMPGMRTSKSLYNVDSASMRPVIVVCEGVVDVWSVGRCGVALFGHTLSEDQRSLLAGAAPNRPWVVIALDPNEKGGDPDKIARALEPAFPGRVLRATLPGSAPRSAYRCDPGPDPKPDPGALTTEAVWSIVRGASDSEEFRAAVDAARAT